MSYNTLLIYMNFSCDFSAKIAGISTILEEHECLHVFVSYVPYNIRVGVVSDIYPVQYNSSYGK